MTDPAAELVAQCQRGDRVAQRELYEMFHRQVFRMTVRMVGRGEAADLTQQVFLQTFRGIGKFSGQSRFETWLFRVTVNECLQHRRRTSRMTIDSLQHEPAAESPAHTDQTEQRELLEQALNRIDPDLSAIFLLREVENYTYDEIAAVLDISEGTVASRLNRARRKLREQLVELGWET